MLTWIYLEVRKIFKQGTDSLKIQITRMDKKDSQKCLKDLRKVVQNTRKSLFTLKDIMCSQPNIRRDGKNMAVSDKIRDPNTTNTETREHIYGWLLQMLCGCHVPALTRILKANISKNSNYNN